MSGPSDPHNGRHATQVSDEASDQQQQLSAVRAGISELAAQRSAERRAAEAAARDSAARIDALEAEHDRACSRLLQELAEMESRLAAAEAEIGVIAINGPPYPDSSRNGPPYPGNGRKRPASS